MGFFSWKTSDTKKSIANNSSSRKTFTVYMITEDGQVFTEKDYEGYGVFGGKDVYDLIAEMNNLKAKNSGVELRISAIDLLYKTIITNGVKSYEAGGKDFFNWETPLKEEGGKTPNQLIKEGWKNVYPNGYGEWEIAAKNGIKLPKFVQKLPKSLYIENEFKASPEEFKKFFDTLPYPEDCEAQGCFYDDEDSEVFSENEL